MPVRIDSIGQILLRKELKEYIKSLDPGDVVKGRVIEASNGEVTIKATNGQVIKASISTDMHLEEGQYIEMQVDNVDEDIVYASLKAVEKKPADPEILLKNLIKNMGLPATATNLAIAKTLIKNNLPVNLETINSIVSQLKSSDILSKASPESVIGLLASGNDLRNTNIDVLGKIAVNFESDVRKYISEYASSDGNDAKVKTDSMTAANIVNADENANAKTDIKTDIKLAVNTDLKPDLKVAANTDLKPDIKVAANTDLKPALKVAANTEMKPDLKAAANTDMKPDLKVAANTDLETNLKIGANTNLETALKATANTEMKPDLIATANAEIKPDSEVAANANLKSNTTEEVKVNKNQNPDTEKPITHVVLDRKDLPKNFTEISSIYKNNGAFSKDSSEVETDNIPLEGKAEKINPEAIKSILEKVGVKATPEIEAFIEKTVNILSKLDSVSLDKLAWLASKGLEATPANLESLDNHINSTNKITYLLDELDKQLSVYSDPNLKNLREIVANLSIRPHELAEVDMVKETLRDLVKAGENIDVYLSKSGINDDGIRNTLSNVKDNIDFMRQINQYSNFIQIPLQMNEKNATADLYVYKDKSRSKLIDPEDATIIIALDLPKSGRIESMIKLNGKSVNATFRLEKSEVGITIKRSEKILSDRLEARGYRLEPIKTIQLNEFFNLIKMEELIGSASIDRLHFDLRV